MFDTERYAREVLAASDWNGEHTSYLTVHSPRQVEALSLLPQVQAVRLWFLETDLNRLRVLNDLRWLFVYENPSLTDLSPLQHFSGLKSVGLSRCRMLRDLSPLARPGLKKLTLYDLHPELSVEPLHDMPDLTFFSLSHPLLIERLDELPIGPELTGLVLGTEARYIDLGGIERWPLLTSLSLYGRTQTNQLLALREPPALNSLFLADLRPLDFDSFSVLPRLEYLGLLRCAVSDLTPLREHPSLERLYLGQCTAQDGGPIDVMPLADRKDLFLTVSEDTVLLGEELFAPERIKRIS
ncbi:hypothetical protein [Streptomyces sp. S1]|uniref:hypothetical protein n=1 Tax=Streptomyces sp. S1 TaxID=718288 RepID=UPI003D761F8C